MSQQIWHIVPINKIATKLCNCAFVFFSSLNGQTLVSFGPSNKNVNSSNNEKKTVKKFIAHTHKKKWNTKKQKRKIMAFSAIDTMLMRSDWILGVILMLMMIIWCAFNHLTLKCWNVDSEKLCPRFRFSLSIELNKMSQYYTNKYPWFLLESSCIFSSPYKFFIHFTLGINSHHFYV